MVSHTRTHCFARWTSFWFNHRQGMRSVYGHNVFRLKIYLPVIIDLVPLFKCSGFRDVLSMLDITTSHNPYEIYVHWWVLAKGSSVLYMLCSAIFLQKTFKHCDKWKNLSSQAFLLPMHLVYSIRTSLCWSEFGLFGHKFLHAHKNTSPSITHKQLFSS